MIRWLAVSMLGGCAGLLGITEDRALEITELSVSTGTLMPEFDPRITRYDLEVGYPDATIEIHAVASDPVAAIEVDGETTGGTGVAAVAVGDSTVDVVARSPSGVATTYQIVVHRGDLDIGFAAPRSVPTQVPGMVSRVEIADLDGDGTPDLGAVGINGEIAVLTNNGAAQFVQRSMFAYGFVRSFAARDLDNDGRPELVVTAGGQLQVAHGSGNGQFDPPVGCGGPPMAGAFALFQFDGDGRLDLAVADQGGRLLPMTGLPSNCFNSLPALDQAVSTNELVVVASGTIDAQLGDDLATLDPVARKLFVHRNLGGGMSLDPVDLGPASAPTELVLADTDGDGRHELIWIDANTDDVVVQPFPGPRGPSFHVGGNPRSLTAADVDGDGRIDVVVLDDGGLTVLHNEGGGTFASKAIPMPLGGVQRFAIADLDGNGRADLVTANFTPTLTVHMGVAP